MAVVFASGFEHADATDAALWDSGSGTYYASAAVTGNYGYRCQTASSATRRALKQFAATGSTSNWSCQVRFNIITAPSGNPRKIWNLQDNALPAIDVCYYTTGGLHYIRLLDGGGSQIGSDYQISLSTWYQSEITYVYSTRAVAFYLDGTSRITGNASATYDNLSHLCVGWETNDTADIYFDDVVLTNTSALPSTGTNGGLKVQYSWAAADGNLDSGETAGTRGGTDSGTIYGQVDETTVPNDATDYAILDASTEAAPVTLYGITSVPIIPVGDKILAVAVSSRVRRGSTGTRNYRRKIRGSSGTWSTLDGSDVGCSSNTWYTNGANAPRLQAVSATDPDTSAEWTRTNLASAEISTRCQGTYPVWCSTEWVEIVHYTPATTVYTLTCDAGSYSLTGTSATLKAIRKLIAATDAYIMTGTSAALALRKTLSATPGAYALTGTDATIRSTRKVIATPGAYAISGTNAVVRAVRKVVATPGSYAETGTDATLKTVRKVIATPGTYALTGTQATVKAIRRLVATPGTFAESGTDATLKAIRKLLADPGSYALTGTSADLYVATGPQIYTLVCTPGAYTMSGTSATLKANRRLVTATDAYIMAGTSAKLTAIRKLVVTPGAYALSGTSGTLYRRFILVASSGVYSVTGTAASMNAVRKLIAQSGAYVLSGTDADLVLILGAGAGRRFQPPFAPPFFPPGQARRQ